MARRHGGLDEIIATGKCPADHTFQPKWDEYTDSYVSSRSERKEKIRKLTARDPLENGGED